MVNCAAAKIFPHSWDRQGRKTPPVRDQSLDGLHVLGMFRLWTELKAQRKRYLRKADPLSLFLIIFSMGTLDSLMGGKKKYVSVPSQKNPYLPNNHVQSCLHTALQDFSSLFWGTISGILPHGWSLSPIHNASCSHPEPFPACSLFCVEQGIDALDCSCF